MHSALSQELLERKRIRKIAARSRVGASLSRIGVIALSATLTLLAGVSAFAGDKVTLFCSGTMDHVFWDLKGDHDEQREQPYPGDGLTIDIDGGTVTGGSDAYPITENKGNLVTFELEVEDPRSPPVVWKHYAVGTIDRISGGLSVSKRDNCNFLGLNHETTFDPAKPLF